MQTLYDSDSYMVNHMLAIALPGQGGAMEAPGAGIADGQAATLAPVMARHGFEIIDKRSGKELYLDGAWAELFQQRIAAWQRSTPTQEEVEDTLEQYAELAQNPVVMH